MNRLLSIIMPVYNTEKYILRCLKSLELLNGEIIIVDDGSTDMSPLILEDYASKHDNIKVIYNNHKGAQQARLIGLQQVRTKYFSFVDSDDMINTENYFKLLNKMDINGFKVANGRMTVFLPNIKIPFNSRKWKKECLDFTRDKLEFSNLTCSLIDKIWHIDCAPLFIGNSKQSVYEDLEYTYHAIASQKYMLHSNDIIYNYCMRGIENNSTSAIGLDSSNVNSLQGLLIAFESMRAKFMNSGLYGNFEDEINAILIKLVYQRIYSIFENKRISNKKQMANLVYQILDSFLPKWRDNKYFKTGFKECEYNDYLFYLIVKVLEKVYNLDNDEKVQKNYKELLSEYDKKIILTEK